MKKVIKKLARATTPETGRAIDVDREVDLEHSERSQLSKMRQHGLVAKVKDETGKQISRHWLITKRGWDLLRGEPVPAKVVVYNNQVLGHEGGVITIDRLDKDADDFEQQPITEGESRAYADVRTKKKSYKLNAIFKGRDYSKKLESGKSYELEIDQLATGKPINMLEPVIRTYEDIAAFSRDWQPL